MNKKSQVTGILFLGIPAVLIGVTFFLFLSQEASAPVTTNEGILENPSATTTETLSEEVTVETPPAINSIVERIETSPDGIKREVRNEVLVKTWGHASGASISLYEKDYFYADFSNEPVKQIALREKSSDGKEIELFKNTPERGPISGRTIGDVDFSPQGTYVTIELRRYESAEYQTYDLRTGRLVRPIEGDYESGYDRPYWNNDESKLVVVRSGAPIDGTEAQLSYSTTGSFEGLTQITPLNETYRENFIYDVEVKDNQLIAKTSSNEWEPGTEGTIMVDMDTGAYTALPEIEW